MTSDTHDAVRARLLAEHPDIRDEYERLKPRYEVITKLIQARHDLNLTQAQLAERMGTTQNAISRLEYSTSLSSARPARPPTLAAGRASRSTLPRRGVLMLKLTRALYRNAE